VNRFVFLPFVGIPRLTVSTFRGSQGAHHEHLL